MAFIEPMHRNKPNITYLLTRFDEFSITANDDLTLQGTNDSTDMVYT